MRRSIFSILLLLLTFTSMLFAEEKEAPLFQDPRDGSFYKTTIIGKQRWMAENLHFKTKNAYCYGDREGNCNIYGNMYTWTDAMKLKKKFQVTLYKDGNIQGICPDGWHVPTNDDWKVLRNYAGNMSSYDGPATSLKSTSYWERDDKSLPGADEFGFNALPGGERDFLGAYAGLGDYGIFWSSTQYGFDGAYIWEMNYDNSKVNDRFDGKDLAFSLRCIEDKTYKIQVKNTIAEKKTTIPVDTVKHYSTVVIGTQVWMSKNMDDEAEGSSCYEEKTRNCKNFGRLYSWETANKICPEGFHLPTDNDWQKLIDYSKNINGNDSVAKSLMAKNAWWIADTISTGTDDFSFKALPAGYQKDSASFALLGSATRFWAASQDSTAHNFWQLQLSSATFAKDNATASEKLSVRCIMNPPDEDELEQLRLDSLDAYYTLTDSRDAQVYKTLQIGTQTWMKENLRYKAEDSYCYENNDSFCNTNGRLYGAKSIAANICPEGYHVPTNEDWETLKKFVKENNSSASEASPLKAIESWTSRKNIPAGADHFGFSALASGFRYGDGSFMEAGCSANFWSATPSEEGSAFYWNLLCTNDEFIQNEDFEESYFSIRCLKDAEKTKKK